MNKKTKVTTLIVGGVALLAALAIGVLAFNHYVVDGFIQDQVDFYTKP